MTARATGWMVRIHPSRKAILVLLTALYALSAGARAIHRPLWHDELFTLYEASLPTAGDLLAAKLDGVDAAPPLDALFDHVLVAVFGPQAWVVRLPALLGVWLAAVCLYLFVRRRTPATYALLAPLILYATEAMAYAVEARPYGMALGLAALSLLSWQRATAGKRHPGWTTMLALCGAAGLATHYYNALVLATLLAGELVRVIHRRRVEPFIPLALALPFLVMIPLAPFVAEARKLVPGTWTPPSLAHIEITYRTLFASTALPLAAALGLFALFGLWKPKALEAQGQDTEGAPPGEFAALCALLALPVLGVLGSLLVTGVFHPRYTLPVVLAPAALVPLLACRLDAGRRAIAAALLVAFSATFAVNSVRTLVNNTQAPDVIARHPLLAEVPDDPAPIAIGNGHVFIQVWHYAPEPLRSRLVFINSIEASSRLEGSDTLARNFAALARRGPIPMVDESFLDEHEGVGVHDAKFGWLVPRLLEEGLSLEARGREGKATLYLARRGVDTQGSGAGL